MGLFNNTNNDEEISYDPKKWVQYQTVVESQKNIPKKELPLPSADFYFHRLDATQQIKDLRHWLAGETAEIVDGERKYIKTHSPICNKEGSERICAIVAPYLDKNIVLGCLTHDEIYDRMRMFWKELSRVVFHNYPKWELPKHYRSMLIRQLVSMVHSSLSRSEEGRESDLISTNISRIESGSLTPEKEKPSMFSPFFRR